MNNKQKTMLGNDWGFALLPCHFSEAITSHKRVFYRSIKTRAKTANRLCYQRNTSL